MDHQKELNDLIALLIQEDGSDLHIGAERLPAIRVAGDLVSLTNRPIPTVADVTAMLDILMGQEKTALFLKEMDADFSYNYQEKTRLRGNAYFQKGLISIALRLIPKTKTLSELNLPPILETFVDRKQGFFLVVGPVGQGKSTTMSAMVNLINQRRAAHIVTIEDPIEFLYESDKSIIDQREIGADTKDFSTALRAVMREDVNVILVGEMRSADTISTAVTAAETGHLVISTLHTNNASQTIDRIIDSFPAGQQDQIRVQLANSLIGVFSQRLIPRIAGGRVPAYELLINTNATSNLIRERRTHEIDVFIETGYENGMIDLNRSLVELLQKGEISLESAMLYSLNPKGLQQLL